MHHQNPRDEYKPMPNRILHRPSFRVIIHHVRIYGDGSIKSQYRDSETSIHKVKPDTFLFAQAVEGGPAGAFVDYGGREEEEVEEDDYGDKKLPVDDGHVMVWARRGDGTAVVLRMRDGGSRRL